MEITNKDFSTVKHYFSFNPIYLREEGEFSLDAALKYRVRGVIRDRTMVLYGCVRTEDGDIETGLVERNIQIYTIEIQQVDLKNGQPIGETREFLTGVTRRGVREAYDIINKFSVTPDHIDEALEHFGLPDHKAIDKAANSEFLRALRYMDNIPAAATLDRDNIISFEYEID